MKNEENLQKQKELTELLIKASAAYYGPDGAIMSDFEYDRKAKELEQMEDESGVILPGSPTVNVGSPTKVSALAKSAHEQPALSLDKVKYRDREDLIKWLGDNQAVISWKMDGLTVVLTYDNGKLTSAVTRGDGIEGSDITHNAKFFNGVPVKIGYDGHLVVRGEAVMSYEEFERVNDEAGGIYENPRNLASATIQMLDANESRKRRIDFHAFELVTPEPQADFVTGDEDGYSLNLRFQGDRLNWLEILGFGVVKKEYADASDILSKIEDWKKDVPSLKFPTDGLVITYNDMVYGMELGNTGHHFRHSIALKWTDETVRTTIRDVEWSVGRMGTVTPVAVFDPVRLGAGSTVTRASLHNLSIMRKIPAVGSSFSTEPVRIGSEVEVYLANMIIPQIATVRNTWDGGLTCPTKIVEIPLRCPVCESLLRREKSNGVETLHCDNPECGARQTGNLMNTFSKDGLFVKGLGESQIGDLLETGLVTADPLSFYQLANEDRTHGINPREDEFSEKVSRLWAKDGWGKKKWDNLMGAIEASRKTTLQKFLYSLNIPLLGNDLSKKLAKHWDNDIESFRAFVKSFADTYPEGCTRDEQAFAEGQYEYGYRELSGIDGVGSEKAKNILDWIDKVTSSRERYESLMFLIDELEFPEAETKAADSTLSGLTFVITGAVHDYKNRDEFKESVEARGGKVAGSVSAKTSFLVNNDVTSTSGKNQKAKELNIPIISEDEFIARFGK